MRGFTFRYTLSGAPPTVRSLPIKGLQRFERGDLLNLESGEVDIGATGDRMLLGIALESWAAEAGPARIDVIVDGDAVYSVEDGNARRRDDALNLFGLSGAQGVATGSGEDLVVVLDSSAAEATLVRINVSRHGTLPATDSATRLNRALARAVAGITRKHLGHGPEKAEAFFHRHVVVVLVEGAMTPGERSLAAAGEHDTLGRVREAVQGAMEPELVSAIEDITGAGVVGFISGSRIEPDMAVDVFVLDRPIRPD
jgi:uncharacterized protein YbcI